VNPVRLDLINSVLENVHGIRFVDFWDRDYTGQNPRRDALDLLYVQVDDRIRTQFTLVSGTILAEFNGDVFYQRRLL